MLHVNIAIVNKQLEEQPNEPILQIFRKCPKHLQPVSQVTLALLTMSILDKGKNLPCNK